MQNAIEPTASFEIPSYLDTDLVTAYAEYEGINDAEEAVEAFEEAYQGTFDSLEAWAEHIMDETGELNEIPARLRYYFDYAAYGRDCELSGDIWTMETNSGMAIFWNC